MPWGISIYLLSLYYNHNIMTIQLPPLPKVKYYTALLSLLNIIARAQGKEHISDKEMKLLVYFLCLPYEKFQYQLFSRLAKTKVIAMAEQDQWDLKKMNLNNKLYSLERKGYIFRDEDAILHPSPLVKKIWQQGIEQESLDINFNLKLIKDDEGSNS